MIMQLYSIFDKASGEFGHPFPYVNNDVAKRAFMIQFQKTPDEFLEDFKLFCVGTFNSVDGSFHSFDPPKLVFPIRKEKAKE